MSNKIPSLPPRAANRQPRIQSIGRIAAILDALLEAPRGSMQLSELARSCGLVKTTAFTLLDSLVAVGMVDRQGPGGYRLGLRNLAYGRAVERHLDIVSIARPALVRLCALTRETVNLALPRPLEAFIVESFEGSRNLRVSSYAGTPAPYHATACGRALLAFQPPAMVDSVCSKGPFERFTERTLVSPGALAKVLAECRMRGFTIEREENELGASCIAAPILAGGVVEAAISIAAPAARLDDAATDLFVDVLLRETAAIGQEIENCRALTANQTPRASRRGSDVNPQAASESPNH
jgi:DNA-binding IclR family transcriptional regulator